MQISAWWFAVLIVVSAAGCIQGVEQGVATAPEKPVPEMTEKERTAEAEAAKNAAQP